MDNVTNTALVTIFITILVITIFISLFYYIALKLEQNIKKRLPNIKPYKWGFFVGCTSISNILLIPLIIKNYNDPIEKLIIFLCIGIIVFCGYLVIKRNRWAFVVLTILHLNPVSWIINGIYIKNRWKELSLDSGKRDFYLSNSEIYNGTKKCPMCAETIKSEAIKCRYCGEMLKTNGIKNNGIQIKPKKKKFSNASKNIEERYISQITTCRKCNQAFQMLASTDQHYSICPKCLKKYY